MPVKCHFFLKTEKILGINEFFFVPLHGNYKKNGKENFIH